MKNAINMKSAIGLRRGPWLKRTQNAHRKSSQWKDQMKRRFIPGAAVSERVKRIEICMFYKKTNWIFYIFVKNFSLVNCRVGHCHGLQSKRCDDERASFAIPSHKHHMKLLHHFCNDNNLLYNSTILNYIINLRNLKWVYLGTLHCHLGFPLGFDLRDDMCVLYSDAAESESLIFLPSANKGKNENHV